MELLRPDIEWDDSERVNVLFGPFQNRNLNPDAWRAKMNFWIETIEKWLSQERQSTFSLENLESELSYRGKRVHCLNEVLQELTRQQRVIRQTDLESKWSKAKSSSWSSWTLGLLRTGVSGLVKKVVGNSEEPVQQEVFVHLEKLETNSKRLLEKMKSSDKCIKVKKNLFLDRVYFDQWEDLRDKDLMINHLQVNGFCDCQALPDGKVYIKIVDKKSSVQDCSFTKQEIDILRLRTCSNELTLSIDEMEKEVKDWRSRVKVALSEGSRTRAKQNLKRSKMIEEAIEKKRNLLDNIDHLLMSIEGAVTNAEVAECYSVGKNALKSQLASMKSVDETHDLLDDIRDLISQSEEVSEAVAGSLGTDEDQELLEELDRLAAEEAKDKSLIDQLNNLGVIDKSLDDLKPQDNERGKVPQTKKQADIAF